MWHGHGMITAKGVRAGMNPAPTNLPKPTLLTFAVYSLEVDFCCVFFLFSCLSVCIRWILTKKRKCRKESETAISTQYLRDERGNTLLQLFQQNTFCQRSQTREYRDLLSCSAARKRGVSPLPLPFFGDKTVVLSDHLSCLCRSKHLFLQHKQLRWSQIL